MIGIGVSEADILELNPDAQRLRKWTWIGRRRDPRPDIEEREQILKIQGLAGDLREAQKQSLKETAQPQERTGQEREVADAELALDGSPHDQSVRQIIRERCHGGEQPAPHGAPYRQRSIV